MSDTDANVFRACTGRAALPDTPFGEAWLVCGRRAGKSFVLALVAVFLACFKSYAEHLGPGERAVVMVIATDRKQARVIFRYVAGLLHLPMLASLIKREAAEEIDLANGVSIEIHVASYRTTRGYTLAAVLCDEIAFWRSDDSGHVAEDDARLLAIGRDHHDRGSLARPKIFGIALEAGEEHRDQGEHERLTGTAPTNKPSLPERSHRKPSAASTGSTSARLDVSHG